MKKIIIITIITCFLLTVLIYSIIPKKEQYILVLGDKMSMGYTFNNVKGYSYNDYFTENREYKIIDNYTNEHETTETLLLKLENNYHQENQRLSLTQAISKSSIITIWIGMEEFSQIKDITNKEIELYYQRLNKIINIIRKYNKQKIFIIGLYYYNKSNIINEHIKRIAKDYSLEYINIENISKYQSFFFTNKNYELNYKGHHYIYKLIEEQLNIACNT